MQTVRYSMASAWIVMTSKPVVYAIDFETYYDKDLSIKNLGAVGYAEATDAYMVSIVGSDGLVYVGHPNSAPWAYIRGWTWVSHNRTFDRAIFEANDWLGGPSEWHCTADLCAYLGIARSLKAAVTALYDIEPSKEVRDNMKGKMPEDLEPEDLEALEEYCYQDSVLCLRIWQDYGHLWPNRERDLSAHTSLMAYRGIHVDPDEVGQAVAGLSVALADHNMGIPWYGEKNDKGKPIALMSPIAFAKCCADHGIEPPRSAAKTSPAFMAWAKKHAGTVPVQAAIAMQESRSINRTLKMVLSINARRGRDEKVHVSLKYGGASTLRWAGEGGFNMQNLTTKAINGVDVRGLFSAEPGHVFINGDLGQIEARALLWKVDDQEQLDMIRGGMDVYEAHARRTMGYTDPRPMGEGDPLGRKIAKARVLGLGYQCWADRFLDFCKSMGLDLLMGKGPFRKTTQHSDGSERATTPVMPDDIPLAKRAELERVEAVRVCTAFREANPGITAFWANLDAMLRHHIGKDMFIKLPSGRSLTYRGVHVNQKGDIVCYPQAGGTPAPFYGGKLVENFIQAMSRDILAEMILRVENEIGPVILHVHDEIICQVTEDRAEWASAKMKEIMTTPPSWAPDLPLSCQPRIVTRYDKD